jgi:hypothetical protein
MLLLAGLTAVAALYRVPRSRETRPSDWALSGTLAALALGLALKAPGPYQTVGDAAGVPHLARVVVDSCALLSAFGTQIVLLHMLRPPEQARVSMRRRAGVASAAVSLMALAFLVADPVAGDADAQRMHAADPGLLQFRILYLAFLTWAFIDIARLCWRFAALADERLMAVGLRCIAAGGTVGLAYVMAGVMQLAGAAHDDVGAVEAARQASNALIGLATVLVVIGSTMPAIAARRQGPTSTHAPGEAVESLWSSLTSALPDVVLTVDRTSAAEETYRRVIEIEDARLALRPLRTREVQMAADWAVRRHGVDPSERSAALEAAALALAVYCRSAGVWCGARGAETAPLLHVVELPEDRDLQSEIDWLSSVGRWYRDAELVGMARQALNRSSTSEAARAH